jgi:hypothetical protein
MGCPLRHKVGPYAVEIPPGLKTRPNQPPKTGPRAGCLGYLPNPEECPVE